jgi:hypothetical protein
MNLTGILTNESQANSSTQNNTGADSPYYRNRALQVSQLTIQTAIAFVGILGNVLVCVVITKRANTKTSMNLYVRNLAIADLGVLLVNFPLGAIKMHGTGWPFGRFVCLYINPAADIFYGASIWSITVIAIERYKNIISRKVFVKTAKSSKSVTLKIVFIWFISFAVIAVPLYPIMISQKAEACFPAWPEYSDYLMLKSYAVCLVIFWYLLPLGIITVTYLKISSQIKQSNTFHKKMHGEDTKKRNIFTDEENQRMKQNKKAQRILTPLVVIFAVTMLPLNVLRLVHGFFPHVVQNKYFYQLLSMCGLCVVFNSAADPIVYYIFSEEFRKGIKAML